MKHITESEFKRQVDANPAWAATITEPVVVVDYCRLVNSNITHLSPLLHFRGRNSDGAAATFVSCWNLKVAEGTFDGSVDFQNSGIRKIGELKVLWPNNLGKAASFGNCKSLTVAEGTYPGFVSFARSGVTRVGKLNITGVSTGTKASFEDCDVFLRKEFLGAEYQIDEPIRKKNLKRIALASVVKTDQKTQPDLEI